MLSVNGVKVVDTALAPGTNSISAGFAMEVVVITSLQQSGLGYCSLALKEKFLTTGTIAPAPLVVCIVLVIVTT